jgi:myosin heavy subunit
MYGIFFSGTVPYNVTGWLEKNKDPLNESVVEQFRKGGNKLVSELFEDPSEAAALSGIKAKRTKGSTFQTVSALYRVFKYLFAF